VWSGWRDSTIDVDVHGDPEGLFRDVQALKEQLGLSIEFVRPEDFVPALSGSADRHVFIEKIGHVSFYHHDPYAQVFSKVSRGFQHDLDDARHFVTSGMVDPERLCDLVHAIPDRDYARYPALSRSSVESAVDRFVEASRG
jgi:hypothetical protein